ncbi:FAD-dependent oxidoreductase [Kutzneria sp. NPDC051319]|uniref:FAD-dependent oxidoreductase n=1 Tax=Kutzneria sp. NPDC051319 TaxID=3155047 RepID=UPI00344156EF
MADVTIVGAGPVGLWTAGELARRGVDVVVLERLGRPSPYSKALVVHPRTLEVLGQRGLAEDPLDRGIRLPDGHFAILEQRLDYGVLDTPYPFLLLFPQHDTEVVLERAARELGVDIRRGHEALAVHDKGDVVVTTVRSGETTYSIESAYLVGADGARSVVRDAAGIEFEGTNTRIWGLLGDIVLDNPPESRSFSPSNEHGSLLVVPLPQPHAYRIVGNSSAIPDNNELTFEQLRAATVAVAGTDFGMRDPIWLSRYGDAAKIASTYRAGRILIAGDAAHIHLPAGGVGMNTGIQDAAGLGWRLADVVHGLAPDSVLDSYAAERRQVGLDLLLSTRAQAVLRSTEGDGLSLRALMSEFIATVPEFSKALAERMSGLYVKYHLPGHPLAGSRAPDLPLAGARASLFAVLHDAQPVVVAAPGLVDAATAAELRQRAMSAQPLAHQERAGWAGVTAALIRPDGHVAWATEAGEGQARDQLIEAADQLRPGNK